MEQISNQIEQNEGLIHAVINRLNYIPNNVEREDLLQIGRIGLWKALANFDSEKGCTVASYCYKTIRFEIMNYLRETQAAKRTFIAADENSLSHESYNNIDEEVGFRLLVEEMQKHISCIDTQMLIDKHVHKLTNKNLESMYHMSERTIIRRLQKAQKVLKENLKWEEKSFGEVTGFCINGKAS